MKTPLPLARLKALISPFSEIVPPVAPVSNESVAPPGGYLPFGTAITSSSAAPRTKLFADPWFCLKKALFF